MTTTAEHLPIETLSREEIKDRCIGRQDFKTAQVWGAVVDHAYGMPVYAFGSSGIMNDDGQDHLLAIINFYGEVLPIHPLASVESIREWFNA